MKTSELKKILEAHGCRKVKEGGDHEQNPKGRRVEAIRGRQAMSISPASPFI